MSITNKKTFNIVLSELDIRVNNDFINSAIVEGVTLDTNNFKINIDLLFKSIIKYEELEILSRKIIEKLGRINKVEFSIRYVDINCFDKAIFEELWENILYLINSNAPSMSGYIDALKWEIEHNNIHILVEDYFTKENLVNKGIDKLIANNIRNEFNIEANVRFETNDNIENNDLHHIIKEKEELNFLQDLSSNIHASTTKDNSVKKKNINDNKSKDGYIYGNKIDIDIIQISNINTSTGIATIEGEIFNIDIKEIKGDKKLYTFNITDFTSSITVKVFANKKQQDALDNNLKEGVYCRLQGDVVYDSFSKQIVIMLKSMVAMAKPEKIDKSKDKRVELHCHTRMSSMDGISDFFSIAQKASKWGHKAIAITDHGVVQSFPEGMEASKKYGIKVLYGVEGYLINDSKAIVANDKGQDINTEFVVFDIETTGLSPRNDRIIEIGAVKIYNNEIVDRFSQLINPSIKLPDKIIELTGITDSMLLDKPSIEEVLPEFNSFIGNSVLVAHNASFDVGFMRESFNKAKLNLENTVLDTLDLSRNLFPELKSHKLNIVAKHLNINLDNHHRAVDDSEATANILLKMLQILKEREVYNLRDINLYFSDNKNIKSSESFHIIIFAKNYKGLKNLYRIISESHLKYFYRKPRIPKSLLSQYRDGLILGTACEAGELYRGILKNKDFNALRDIVNFYDFLEIQPIHNNLHLIKDGSVRDIEELKNINRKIANFGAKFNKPVVATGDVHFLDQQDEVYRRILMSGQGFSDADDQAPLYFKTTEEMLNEFSYLGDEKSKEVVVYNTNFIADMIDDIQPIPDGTYPPIIEGADEELRNMTYSKAIRIYGDPLPNIVKDRLDRELNSIIKNGYAVMYIIAQKLVTKSLTDGYLVGSRGSVGSSLAATMSDITEVNPLPPHYICPSCKNSEFIIDGSIGSGVDLPNKICPACGTEYNKDGFDIPFEVFLGFEGDKEPDIDLNFAGEYQAVAHKYTEELFGNGYVFRAGTIGTIAEKTAYGFVKKYYDEKGIQINPAEINRLVKGCTGIKRTSGQHPGGVMIVPKYKDVYDFTPVQYPADDKDSGVITTHFDYHSISGRILKLDILGHDVPTIIRMLEDITGVDPQSISLDDKRVIKIFTSTKPLGVTDEEINSTVGTLGIPEFGTKFVRQMLVDTMPTTFAELVRISGLAHGTDVWLNNAQELVRDGITNLNGVISTRDDIMLYLISYGLDKKKSFKIMEKVRKGKGLSEEDEIYMRENNIPEWYIESCNRIKYMFPKAHAAAYVMMSFRIAYFKVYYPEAFYATYFTSKATDFDAELIVKGKESVEGKIKELDALGNDKSAKEKNLLTVLEVVLEMYCRGIAMKKVDLYKSDSDKFIVDKDGIIPPLKSLQGVGENAARSIVQERNYGNFLSIEDLVNRAKVTKTVIEALKVHGCLDGMSESNQLSLFNI